MGVDRLQSSLLPHLYWTARTYPDPLKEPLRYPSTINRCIWCHRYTISGHPQARDHTIKDIAIDIFWRSPNSNPDTKSDTRIGNYRATRGINTTICAPQWPFPVPEEVSPLETAKKRSKAGISCEISTPTPLFRWLIANQAPNKLALTSTVSISGSINIVPIGFNTGREHKGFDLAISHWNLAVAPVSPSS